VRCRCYINHYDNACAHCAEAVLVGELWRHVFLHQHLLRSQVVLIVDLLLPWLESPLYRGRVDFYERVLTGAPWTASPFHELNQGYNRATLWSGISHGSRCHQPRWRHLPCTWSLSMHLVSFAVPGLAASLRSCTCTKSQQQSAAPLRCTYCEGRELRAVGETFVHACSVGSPQIRQV
jgi:hypothetical protein